MRAWKRIAQPDSAYGTSSTPAPCTTKVSDMNKRHVSDARYAWKQQTPEQKAKFALWLAEHGLAEALYDIGFRGRDGFVGEVSLDLPDTLPFSQADQREEGERLRMRIGGEVLKKVASIPEKYLEGFRALPWRGVKDER